MTPVHFHFVSPTGDPIVNADVEIQLSQAAFDTVLDGVVLPRLIQLSSDADGRAVANLWPNDAPYIVTALDPLSDAGVTYQFYVPTVEAGLSVRLQDLVVEGTLPTVPYDAATLAALVEAKATTLSHMTEAVAASESASASAATAAASATYSGPTPPANPSVGRDWVNTVNGKKYTWVNDGDSGQWVEAATFYYVDDPVSVTSAENAAASAAQALDAETRMQALTPYAGPVPPMPAVEGREWWNTANGKRYLFIDDGNTQQWVESAGYYYLSDLANVQRVSADKGDANFTLALGTSEATAYVNTPLTANRQVTFTLNPGSFSTPDQANGGKFRVVRSSASTGAFTLDVGGLKSLAPGQWCDIQWNGVTWLLTGSGPL